MRTMIFFFFLVSSLSALAQVPEPIQTWTLECEFVTNAHSKRGTFSEAKDLSLSIQVDDYKMHVTLKNFNEKNLTADVSMKIENKSTKEKVTSSFRHAFGELEEFEIPVIPYLFKKRLSLNLLDRPEIGVSCRLLALPFGGL